MAAITYKCPNCGGGLKFDPKLQKYKCEFCLSVFTQEELEKLAPKEGEERQVSPEEAEFYESAPENQAEAGSGKTEAADASGAEGAEAADRTKTAGAVVYTCPSCGAQNITDANTAATFCYYCHSPIVLQGKLSGKYLPDRVIPFKYDRKAAEERFTDYVWQKKFVPKAFFSKEQIEKLSGVYYPFWVYDGKMDGHLSGRADRIRTWVTGDREFTETNVYHVERSGEIQIQNLSRNALSDSDRNLIDAVMPFRLKETEPFRMGYLQGFVAQKRDIESEQVAGEMRGRAEKYAKTALRRTVKGYTTVTASEMDIAPQEEHFSYMLLPVWLLTYKALDGKKFYFAMNGQTGEIHGKLPVSYGKLAGVSGILGGVVFGVILSLLYFLM